MSRMKGGRRRSWLAPALSLALAVGAVGCQSSGPFHSSTTAIGNGRATGMVQGGRVSGGNGGGMAGALGLGRSG
ncbi:MAG: hypothetical protein ACRDD1_10770, partial [Planctomycetia bacterium]